MELVVWHQTDEGGRAKRKQNSSDTQAPRGERNLTDPTSSPVSVASGTDDNTAGFVQRKSNVSRYTYGFLFHKEFYFL